MKRSILFACTLSLVAGLLVGGVLPMPWDSPAVFTVNTETIIYPPEDGSGVDASTAPLLTAPEPLNSKDSVALLNTACSAVQALKEHNYTLLSTLVHPERGVTFTPYSTVNFETDRTFTRDQVKNLAKDEGVYTWGVVDGRGSLIELTMAQYFEQYVFDADYTQVTQIGVDQIIMGGNALENLPEAYPGCRFVDFTFPGTDASIGGLDWCSLKLVFAPGDTSWLLVGVVHGQWTI